MLVGLVGVAIAALEEEMAGEEGMVVIDAGVGEEAPGRAGIEGLRGGSSGVVVTVIIIAIVIAVEVIVAIEVGVSRVVAEEKDRMG